MQGFWRRFIGNPRVALGLVWLAFIVAVAAAAPLLAPSSPFAIVSKPFAPPFGEFLFGTDSLGRSLLAGLIHGARTSLLIAILATLAASPSARSLALSPASTAASSTTCSCA
jgi:peptide/nickel transport system permease protein